MKKGLALEGGAMRGMFTAGVLDVWMENHIGFDLTVGVSAGAAFGCNYKSHQIGRAIRYNARFCSDRRYCGLSCLLTDKNLYHRDFCYRQVPMQLDPFDFETYRKDPMEFFVVCTDVNTGKAHYHRYDGEETTGFDWIRASASMPLVSTTVPIDGHFYLDGGVSDSIPFRFLEEQGCEKKVVVLTQPKDYRKKKNGAIFLIRSVYRKYPAFVRSMEQRHQRYNCALEELTEREEKGEVFVIRPPEKLPVKRIEKDPERLKIAYRMGREEALARLPELKKYLALDR